MSKKRDNPLTRREVSDSHEQNEVFLSMSRKNEGVSRAEPYSSLRSRALGMSSCARYLAIVRLATL